MLPTLPAESICPLLGKASAIDQHNAPALQRLAPPPRSSPTAPPQRREGKRGIPGVFLRASAPRSDLRLDENRRHVLQPPLTEDDKRNEVRRPGCRIVTHLH